MLKVLQGSGSSLDDLPGLTRHLLAASVLDESSAESQASIIMTLPFEYQLALQAVIQSCMEVGGPHSSALDEQLCTSPGLVRSPMTPMSGAPSFKSLSRENKLLKEEVVRWLRTVAGTSGGALVRN